MTDFTAHYYGEEPLDHNIVLRHAEKAINSATLNNAWSIPEPEGLVLTLRNSYIYRHSPPRITSHYDRPTLKEWGEPPSLDEIYTLADVPDFNAPAYSTLDCVDVSEKAPDHARALLPRDSTKQDQTKVSSIIPRPHFHPSPYLSERPLIQSEIFSKTLPAFLDSYESFSFPSHARLIWVVPVNGRIPWEGCTPATVISSSQDESILPPPGAPEIISWTSRSLLAFWTFLLHLRATEAYGSIGIAFESSRSRRFNTPPITAAITPPEDSGLLTPPPTSPLGVRLDQAPSLAGSDVVKIYHEAWTHLLLRKALDDFTFAAEDTFGPHDIPVLRGARFVLLDERSQGVLVL